MKLFFNVFIFLFIFLLSSCYHNLSFNDSWKQPKLKNDELSTIAIVINGSYKNDSFYITNNDFSKTVNFPEIRKSIKRSLESNLERPCTYFYDLNSSEIENLRKQYNKVIIIDMTVSKTLNFTGLFDYMSVIYPFPAPEWGNYIFNNTITVIGKDNRIQKFNYTIISDFSYLIYPLYRNDAQITAVKKAIYKLVDEILNNEELLNLISSDKAPDIDTNVNYTYLVEESGVRLVQRDGYSKYPISIDFRSLTGISTINGYYNLGGRDFLGATGRGFVKEFKVQASSYKPITKFYLTPTIGYYYQDIQIQDFGYDTRDSNYNKDGFIPGRVEERDENGNLVSDGGSNPYSLKYESEFSSTYLGGKMGINLIFGDNEIRFLFSPLVYFSLIEARHTTITADKNKFSDWTFPLGGIIGFNFETGLFFPKIHLGIKTGYDLTYFRKFDFKYNINFNKVVTDENNIKKGSKIQINKFDVFSNRFFFDVFVVF